MERGKDIVEVDIGVGKAAESAVVKGDGALTLVSGDKCAISDAGLPTTEDDIAELG